MKSRDDLNKTLPETSVITHPTKLDVASVVYVAQIYLEWKAVRTWC